MSDDAAEVENCDTVGGGDVADAAETDRRLRRDMLGDNGVVGEIVGERFAEVRAPGVGSRSLLGEVGMSFGGVGGAGDVADAGDANDEADAAVAEADDSRRRPIEPERSRSLRLVILIILDRPMMGEQREVEVFNYGEISSIQRGGGATTARNMTSLGANAEVGGGA
jgi:hypothetical protein